jgi:hypothetical protein
MALVKGFPVMYVTLLVDNLAFSYEHSAKII